MVRKADTAFQTFQEKVFHRDDYTCQFCGFRAKQYMDVINFNGDYHHNRINNLVTACGFCSQCFFLESVGRDEQGGGVLIILPEMTQGELNALCHVLFTAIMTGGPAATDARNIYRGLKLRAQRTEKLLGEGMSNPTLVGQLLVDSSGESRQKVQDKLQSSVRLLPDMQRFAESIKTWILEGLSFTAPSTE